MKTLIDKAKQTFFNDSVDLRIRIFNLLAIAGIICSAAIAVLNSIIGVGSFSTILCIISGMVALFLLAFSFKTGRYQFCYMAAVISIFIVGFTLLFFSSGGYYGGMPAFFIFGIVFTAYILEGKKMFGMIGLEAALYVGVCLYGFYNPQKVLAFESEQALLTDIIASFLVVSLVLSVTMYMQFKLYQNQHYLLEQAREEAVEASNAKSAFLANMSHEIRTPINTMLGMNEMILRESASEQITAYSTDIQKAGETMLSLIGNILDISKIESGRLELEEKPYHLTSFLADLILIGREQAERKRLSFFAEIEEEIPSVLVGDAVQIKQIVTNFISNAVKYTEQGKITLRVRRQDVQEDMLRLCISVTDTGVGIREEDFDILFDTFSRANQQAHYNIEGTGLGLAIAKELAERMHGQIFFASVYGEGSTFGVEIPQRIKDETPIGQWTSRREERERRYEESFLAPKGRLLVVDDNDENLWVIQALLKRTLLQIDTAKSGREALEKLGSQSYHIILMDYMMPNMNGLETLQQLRAQYPQLEIPVIALTANAIAGTERLLLRDGFSGYLTKPVMWKKLEDMLLSFLPEELVTHTGFFQSTGVLTKEREQDIADKLAQYDIVLAEGLRFLQGDLLQFEKRAEFFTENFAVARSRMEAMNEQRDWENIVFEIHSLKSSAHALGAMDLYYTAARMEKRCYGQDFAYIESAMALLLLEWDRANAGLLMLIDLLRDAVPEPSRPQEAFADIRDVAEGEKRLMDAIAAYQWKEALRELAYLMGASQIAEELEKLKAVQTAVDGLKFDQAEILLEAYLQNKGVERSEYKGQSPDRR